MLFGRDNHSARVNICFNLLTWRPHAPSWPPPASPPPPPPRRCRRRRRVLSLADRIAGVDDVTGRQIAPNQVKTFQ